jgi:hypothetical protein
MYSQSKTENPHTSVAADAVLCSWRSGRLGNRTWNEYTVTPAKIVKRLRPELHFEYEPVKMIDVDHHVKQSAN